MLKANKSHWFEKAFAIYNRNLLQRRFQRFSVSGLEFLQNKNPALPLIIYANHSAWWDGLVIFEIQKSFAFEHFIMMEEKHLRRLPLFRRLGAFSVVRENARAAGQSIDYAAGLLRENPNRAVTIFPQGEILPNDRRPLDLFGGLAQMIKKTGFCAALPIALRYEFLGDYKPEIFVKIVEPDVFEITGSFNKKAATESFAARLTVTLDDLKHDITNQKLDGYVSLF